AQGAHVVHDLASGVHGGAGDFSLVSIHGEDCAGPLAQDIFNHRHNAAQLFVGGNAAFHHGRSGPGGFATDVEQVCAVVEHLERVGHGAVAGQKFAAIGK